MRIAKDDLINSRILIVIVGPTASGKTALALSLASVFDSEIISADSRQIFKYLDIGTAKPTKEELSKIKHHFIDIIFPDQYYSAGLFGKQASDTVNSIFNLNKVPVVAGGSGLYIKALCEGFFEEEIKPDPNLRKELQSRFESEGIEPIYSELEKIDPVSATLYIDRNPRRVIRALEFYYSTGIPISTAQQKLMTKPQFTPIYFGIQIERQKLYEWINERAKQMWEGGLIDETSRILEMGYSPSLNSLNTVGYKECIDFINGNLNANKALELIAQNTRHYAKRQFTWLRQNADIHWVEGDLTTMTDSIIEQLSLFLKK
jgi:tRNA dimethylallyltransferase